MMKAVMTTTSWGRVAHESIFNVMTDDIVVRVRNRDTRRFLPGHVDLPGL